MSRAFVKGADEEALEDLPDRPISPFPNYVTAEGLAQIEAALAHAHEEHAAAQRENNRPELARTARDLRYWTARRASAEVFTPSPDVEGVQFGSTVTLLREDGRRQSYRIVGEDEADPSHGTLSHAAPLARALFGKAIGEDVKAGPNEMKIIDIR